MTDKMDTPLTVTHLKTIVALVAHEGEVRHDHAHKLADEASEKLGHVMYAHPLLEEAADKIEEALDALPYDRELHITVVGLLRAAEFALTRARVDV